MEGPTTGGGAPNPEPSGLKKRLRKRLVLLSPWGPPLAPGGLTKAQRRLPAVAGTLAATTALLAALVLRFQGVGLFVPEVAVEWVVDHLPGSFEATAIGLMGGFAKVLAVAVAIGGFLAVHAFFALYFPRAEKILGERWKTLVAFAALPAAAALLLVLPLFGAGLAGADAPGGAGAAALSVILGASVYSLVLDLAYREFSKSHPQGIDITRRTAIQGAFIFLVAASLGTVLLANFVTRVGRLAYSSVAELVGREVTPTAEFYVVSKNLMAPAVDPSTWTLAVDGLVDRPLSFTSNELLARTLREDYVTLECVSNGVGGNLISNARWSGVPLSEFLSEAGVQPSATWALFTCADDYTVGVPLLRAGAQGAMLALHMNGERLPREHGFPARALVPGLYGMMNAKWVTRITLVDHEVEGYWQQKGWTNDGRIRTTAMIAVAPTSIVDGSGPVDIGGVAFAGDRPITRVEVSDDGGSNWNSAALRAPLSPYAWTLWTYRWQPPRTGRVRLIVRAWERQGAAEVVQENVTAAPFPDGAAGYDAVDVEVTA